jgi:hypothetical protein
MYKNIFIIAMNEMTFSSSHTTNNSNLIETLQLKLTNSTDELYQANMRVITLEEEIRLLKGHKLVMNKNEKLSVTWSDKLSHPEEEDFNNNNNVTLLDDEFRLEFENMKQQLYNSNITIEKLQYELKEISQHNNHNHNNNTNTCNDMDIIFTSSTSTRNHSKCVNNTTTSNKNKSRNNNHNSHRNDFIYNDIENHKRGDIINKMNGSTYHSYPSPPSPTPTSATANTNTLSSTSAIIKTKRNENMIFL